MKAINQTRSKILTLISVICLFIPVIIYILWLHAINIGKTQKESVIVFRDYFPDFLNGRYDTTIISIIFSFIAVILTAKNLNDSKRLWRFLNIIVLGLGSILLFLNFFSIL
jgi:hypothetical protein